MKSYSKYIEVAVALPVKKTFTYEIPDIFLPFAAEGKRVLVPFNNRIVTGYILGPCGKKHDNGIKLITDVLDTEPLFPESMVPFFRWIADYYMHPVGEVIKSALPGGININDFAVVEITEKGKNELSAKSVTPLERGILARLKQGSCRKKSISKIFGYDIPASLVCAMDRSGLITIKRAVVNARTKPKFKRFVSIAKPDKNAPGQEAVPKKITPARKKIIDILKVKGELSVDKLKELIPTAPAMIKSMEKNGLVAIYGKKIYRDPFGEPIEPDTAPVLTGEQKKVIASIQEMLGTGFASVLLSGVTGSGKTEVYMQLSAVCLKQGFSVLVLVPEISLITQTERRFRSRFGECIAVLHSDLSSGERYDQWERIASGEAKITIGARSAIFAPFSEIGLIIVDEEHDTSYKQDSAFCYNARDLAVLRAKLSGGIALLGSATPSIQSQYNVVTKKFFKTHLTKRVKKRSLPEISIVDLRKYRDARGVRRFITPELFAAMKETLARKEQILLFLNRRGYASHPVCAACGEPVTCKNCSVTLTLHKQTNAYRCHYCGYMKPLTSHCTVCGSSSVKLLGYGTEKLEAAVSGLFPDVRVARMDRDTTRKKGAIRKILKNVKSCKTDILIGTQMIAKGHDFLNITLVGIICADLSLNFPDFRAGERTFQLLSQVSGRAGRGDAPGKVILQTFNTSHFSILAAKNQDYETFYNREIHMRKSLCYPPFSRIVQLKISGKDKEKTSVHAKTVGNLCHELIKSDRFFAKYLNILGPVEAIIPMVAKKYRWQILLKSISVKSLHEFLDSLLHKNRSRVQSRHVKVVPDIDPFFMM